MNRAILVLALLNLAMIGSLPRIFFRRGRLNPQWWLTASPFFVAALVLLAGLGGLLPAALPPSDLRESAAAVLCAASMTLIGLTVGTHQRPLSLWHQQDEAPTHLVTHGAYAWIRHPFYSAFLLALLGAAAAFPHWGTAGVFAFALAQLNRTAAGEERALLGSALGSEYRDYLARTGRFWPRSRTARPRPAQDGEVEPRLPQPAVTSSARHGYVPTRM